MAGAEDANEPIAVPQPAAGADASDIATQENVSPRGQVARQSSTKNQVRHRASVACASCRDRRIRCVVPQGQAECNQCRRTGTECIIKNDDERRRPISKAYMSSLSDRISMLEGMLLDKGVQPPPAVHPPKTRHENHSKAAAEEQAPAPQPTAQHVSLSQGVPSPPDSRNEDFMLAGDVDHHNDAMMSSSSSSQLLPGGLSKEDSPFRMLDAKQEDIVYRLLATKGNLSFDQLSGRLRFFGPTANSHVYAESPDQFDSREPPEQVRRAERIIRSLTTSTHDYLMNHFWEYYNSVLRVIDREAFEADRDSQNPKFYSSFLHITVLAMGYRGADMDREDMKKISLGNRESTLHREAKYMLDIELERPGGIPSVQALLLLSDLECGVGRDNTGWMYSGMANRLAFDVGLHLDCRTNGMPEQEIKIRHMVMRACTIYDKYWALFLGRPTSIKSQDIGMDLLQSAFSQLTSAFGEQTPAAGRDVTGEIYEQLIELMDLAGRIVETRDHSVVKNPGDDIDRNNIFAVGEAEDNAYLHVVKLDRRLQNWYRRLPDHLAWKPANVKTAPYSYFLLHQQYHVSMILLHRPWAKYGAITGDGASTGSHPSPDSGHQHQHHQHHHLHMGPESAPQHPGAGAAAAAVDHSMGMGDPHSMVHDSRTSLSRSICTQQAIRVARIFWQHRQRFDGRKIFVTGIQHAGTASIALIAALAYQRNDADRRTYLGYLEILSDALNDMSCTYHPASRMDSLLKAVLAQLRTSMGEPSRSSGSSSSIRGGLPLALDGSFSGSAGRTRMSGASDMAAPVVPSRREAGDSDLVNPAKRRRPGNSRRASEYARPPPPFFPGAQPTPPQSFTADLHQRTSSQAEPMMFHVGSADAAQMNLDFLGGSAVDVDAAGDDRMDGRHRSDGGCGDMDLLGHGSDGWGMGSMHSDHHHHHHHHTFDPSPMGAEWNSGPAGLSASSVLNHSAALTTGLMSNNSTLGATPRTVDGGGDDDDDDDDRGHAMLNGMSPGSSLNGLVQSVEKDGDVNRNHELDFFSFT